MCPTEKRAFAWIQGFLEPVCRRGGTQGWAAPLWGKKSVGTQQRWGKMRRGREESILDVMEEDQCQQSEKIVTVIHQISYESDSQLFR